MGYMKVGEMTIELSPELEAALAERARREEITVDLLVVNA